MAPTSPSRARPPLLLPETLPVADAMRQLRTQREQFALVVDEHGAIDGIITMEDLVEEVVGEIYDETDRDIQAVVRESDDVFLVPGSFPIHDLPDLGIDIDKITGPDYTTVAGLIIDRIGHIPTEHRRNHHPARLHRRNHPDQRTGHHPSPATPHQPRPQDRRRERPDALAGQGVSGRRQNLGCLGSTAWRLQSGVLGRRDGAQVEQAAAVLDAAHHRRVAPAQAAGERGGQADRRAVERHSRARRRRPPPRPTKQQARRHLRARQPVGQPLRAQRGAPPPQRSSASLTGDGGPVSVASSAARVSLSTRRARAAG